jgi:hypothetical protein
MTNRLAVEPKVFVGVPVYGPINPDFFCSWTRLIAEFQNTGNNLVIPPPHIGDSLIPRARNSITRGFLDSDCTHLLFIDSDLIFSAEHIRRIISHDKDLVGGTYCKKMEGPVQFVCNSYADQTLKPDERGLMPVRYVGTGFMCIKRRVFEEMIKAFGEEIWYALDHDQKTVEYDFWGCQVYKYPDGKRRYLSEDWWFCQKWLDLGGKVWMDFQCVLKHSGSAIYPLKTQEPELNFKRQTPLPLESNAGDSVSNLAESPAINLIQT